MIPVPRPGIVVPLRLSDAMTKETPPAREPTKAIVRRMRRSRLMKLRTGLVIVFGVDCN